jgi:hypothetical protein
MPLIDELRAMPDGDPPALLLGHGGTSALMLPRVFPNIDHAFTFSRGLDHTDYVQGRMDASGGVCTRWGSHVPAAV